MNNSIASDSIRKLSESIVLSGYKEAAERLTMELLPVRGNEDWLNSVPHTVVGDLAVLYRIMIDDEEQTITIKVNKELCSFYGIDAERLHADALVSAPVKAPAEIEDINTVIKNMFKPVELPLSCTEEDGQIFVATTKNKMYGASVILYPGFLSECAKVCGGSYYVIPSSIHEVLLIPASADIGITDINRMIAEVNETCVMPDERLSDHAYFYNADSEEIIW